MEIRYKKLFRNRNKYIYIYRERERRLILVREGYFLRNQPIKINRVLVISRDHLKGGGLVVECALFIILRKLKRKRR